MFKDRFLKTSGEILNKFASKFWLLCFKEMASSGFETRKAEVEIFPHSHGLGEMINRLAHFGHFGQNWSAWVTKHEHTSDFVVGFAGCIIESLTQ